MWMYAFTESIKLRQIGRAVYHNLYRPVWTHWPLISPVVFLFLPFLNIFGYRFLDHFGVHLVLANVYDIKSSLMLSRHKPQPESMLTWVVYAIWLSTLLS